MTGALPAWGLCGVTALLAAARLGLAIADPASSSSATGPDVPGGGIPVAAFESVVLLAIGVIGALVASRQPRNAIGWLLCTISVSLGLLVLGAHLFWALAPPGTTPSRTAELVAWVASWSWVPAMVSVLTLFPLLFPTGRPPTPRWRPVVWMAASSAALLLVGAALEPGRFEDYPVDNPFGAGQPAVVIGWVGFALMAVTALTSLGAMLVRFRRSRGAERQQLKWVVLAAAMFVVVFAVPVEELAGDDVGFATLLLGILIIAASVAVAVLRYRLYDIDVVINRTLVYAGLTATLAAAYLSGVLLLQLALRPLTESSSLAVACSTLAVAALFRPARDRIQAGVDHRFYRRKYDAARTVDRFSARLRDEVDLDALGTELRSVVTSTMQPAHVSLWLRGSRAQVRR